jgi:hypothetical protein
MARAPAPTASAASRRAASIDVREVLLGQRGEHGDRGDARGRQLVDGGTHHRGPTARVHGEVRRREVRDGSRRTGDGVRNVVELEVEEDVATTRRLARGEHGRRAVAQEGLEPDLHGRDVRAGRTGPGGDGREIGAVEGDGDGRQGDRGAHPSTPASIVVSAISSSAP